MSIAIRVKEATPSVSVQTALDDLEHAMQRVAQEWHHVALQLMVAHDSPIDPDLVHYAVEQQRAEFGRIQRLHTRLRDRLRG